MRPLPDCQKQRKPASAYREIPKRRYACRGCFRRLSIETNRELPFSASALTLYHSFQPVRAFIATSRSTRTGQKIDSCLLFRHPRKTHRERCPRLLLAASHPATARHEPVSDQRPDRQPAIGVTNLLPLDCRPRMIRDRHFANPLPHAAQLRRNLGAEFESS